MSNTSSNFHKVAKIDVKPVHLLSTGTNHQALSFTMEDGSTHEVGLFMTPECVPLIVKGAPAVAPPPPVVEKLVMKNLVDVFTGKLEEDNGGW